MRSTKIAFGLLILFFACFLAVTPFLYSQVALPRTSMIIENPVFTAISERVSYELGRGQNLLIYTVKKNVTENSTGCAFAPPEEPTVILRMDDLGAWHYYDIVNVLNHEIIQRDMAVTFAVIPFNLQKDELFVDYIDSLKRKDNIEIAQHGFLHNGSEFQNLTYDPAYEKIQEGKAMIQNNLGITPLTFIPPSNDYNSDTLKALNDSGFEIVSARDSEYKSDGEMTYIGADIGTYDFSREKFVPVEEIMEACREAIKKKNVCVITFHPQDYSIKDDPGKIDETKYFEFTRLLDELKAMDVEFKTFKDLVECQEEPISKIV